MRTFNEILGKIEEKLAPPRISKFIEWLKNDDDKSDPKETDHKHAKIEKSESVDRKDLIIDGVKLQPVTGSTTDKDSVPLPEPKIPSMNGSKPEQNPKEPVGIPVKK